MSTPTPNITQSLTVAQRFVTGLRSQGFSPEQILTTIEAVAGKKTNGNGHKANGNGQQRVPAWVGGPAEPVAVDRPAITKGGPAPKQAVKGRSPNLPGVSMRELGAFRKDKTNPKATAKDVLVAKRKEKWTLKDAIAREKVSNFVTTGSPKS